MKFGPVDESRCFHRRIGKDHLEFTDFALGALHARDQHDICRRPSPLHQTARGLEHHLESQCGDATALGLKSDAIKLAVSQRLAAADGAVGFDGDGPLGDD